MSKTALFRRAFAAANPSEFEKTVTPRHQALLSLFAFEDAQSEINAYQILRGQPMPRVPNPITIITGLPGTGKTALAHILGMDSSGRQVSRLGGASSNQHSISKKIEVAVINKVSPILFDNLFSFDCFQSQRLHECATASSFTVRRLGSQKFESFSDLPQIFITAPHGTSLPADLVRRSRVIRLSPFLRAENVSPAAA